MNITVLGCGRWGSFLAWYCARIGHNVTLCGRPTSARMAQLLADRRNDYLTLPDSKTADVIIISIGAQQLRLFLREIKHFVPDGKKFILCMKGLESGTGKRLTTVFNEELGARNNVAVWVGPGHVQDFVNGIPNCMVIASDNSELTQALVDTFKSPLIRFYYGRDLIGIEIGAAAKNVVGLAAGMLDGLNYSSLKGALMARGTAELSRLIEALGGDRMTVYGLSHLGDYEATLFSEHSNNRRFGEDFIRQKPFDKLAEGVETVKDFIRQKPFDKLAEGAGRQHHSSRKKSARRTRKALSALNQNRIIGGGKFFLRALGASARISSGKSRSTNLPRAPVDNIIHHNKNPRGELERLFLRSTKIE